MVGGRESNHKLKMPVGTIYALMLSKQAMAGTGP